MASKKKTSAAVGIFIAVAAVIFFFVIIAVVLNSGSDGDAYENKRADYGMVFESFDVEIDWDDDRTCKITQTLDVRFYEASHGIYVDIPVNSGEKVRDLEISTEPTRPYSLEHENNGNLVRAVVGDPDIYFRSGDRMRCVVSYDYITPKHPKGADILAINAIGSGWTCPTEFASVTVKYPSAPKDAGSDFGIWIGSTKHVGGDDGAEVSWSADGKTVTIDIDGRGARPHTVGGFALNNDYALDPFEKVELAYEMPAGTLKNAKNSEFVVTLVIGIILVASAALIKLLVAKNKPVTPVVGFYPPFTESEDGEKRRMLPVQMGKIIDNSCSAQDVTSLIFYWASQGYLAIEERDGETYLKRVKDVEAVTAYERRMFDKIFSFAKADKDGTQEVAVSALSGKFGTTVAETKSAVDAEYRGKFYRGGITAISVVLSVLCGLFGALVSALSTLRIGKGFFNFLGVVAIVAAVAVAVVGTWISRYRYKLSGTQRKLAYIAYAIACVGIGVLLMFIIPVDASSDIERAIAGIAFAVASAIAPFIAVRTDYYNETLGDILGFRDFLRDAEKDRLETLIADDPQYYYNILPYANVLGVTDVWADKFKGLEVPPPTYYTSDSNVLFDILILSHLSRSISSSLTYVPSSNKGSLSGGGHSGGGFSGGSFGGGGGGRW
ncbi:MAG: DUF2207 domain-containing protein [Roseburia sp.]|nr:DUF2207 domain-containing protein [Roseburia sp.]